MHARSRSETRDEHGHLLRELHGVTLAQILEYLVARLGFPELARRITINCFALDPSVSSSLTFLRRTPWARAKVETLYIDMRSDDLRAQERPIPQKDREDV
jgi:uncharacterized protein (DUF2132 family)